MKKLVFCMLWLTCHNICVECVEESDKTVVTSDSTTKEKRYLHHGISHDSSSPCPPFYPHFHTSKLPMHAIKPYGPMSYPKPVYGPPPMAHHAVQYIHQPTYMSYVPKQTISYAKPQVSMPLYHYLPSKPMVHHEQPIQHIVKQQVQWQPSQPHLVNYEKPHFAYAPSYHKPMVQQVPYMKGWEAPINYHTAHANNFIAKPGIVYKSESHYCEPCHQAPLKPLQYKPLPQISHVPPTYIKPVVHPIKPASYYIPSQPHAQLPIIKHTGHEYPCSK